MDINSLSTEKANADGVPLVLVNPSTGDDLVNDDGKPMTLYMVGKDSREYRTYLSQMHSKYRGKKEPSFGQSEKMGNELLASCTKYWENMQLDGEVLEFSNTAARALYKKYSIIRKQADDYLDSDSNFLDPSAQN